MIDPRLAELLGLGGAVEVVVAVVVGVDQPGEGAGAEPAPLVAAPWTARVICACGVLVLAIGVYPLPFANAARAAMAVLGGR